MIAHKHLLRALVMVLIVGAGVASATDDELSADERAGIDAYNQGDLVGAMVIFERAAAAGSALAQTRLGWILDGANDDERAVEMYRAAAEQGFAPGMHGLGEMYAKGEGVERDLAAAVVWFARAADAGHDKSLRLLIGAYENGELGLDVDPAKVAAYRDKLERISSNGTAASDGR